MFSNLLELFYPNLCFACNGKYVQKNQNICLHCEYKINHTNYYKLENNPVAERFFGRIKLERAATAYTFTKGGLLQNLIHSLKYNNRPEIGLELGKLYASYLKEDKFWSHQDYIIPVPLHPKKEFQRGYNQAERWASGLSEILGIPVKSDILFRNEFTDSQTKKSRMDRFYNVENVFSIKNQNVINGKHLILVDDVLTTGATLEACAQTLINAADIKLSILCIALAS